MSDMHPLIEEARRIGKARQRAMAAYKGPPLPFEHLGNQREADMPWLSHEEAAGAIRMLLRSDLDHETICCMARDRILHLAQENERLKAALKPFAAAADDLGDQKDTDHLWESAAAMNLTAGDLRRAHALCSNHETKDQANG